MKVWLVDAEAARLVQKSVWTLRKWRLAHIVSARKRKGVWEYEHSSLLRAKQVMDYRYEHRRIVPGPGRGRHTPGEGDPTLW